MEGTRMNVYIFQWSRSFQNDVAPQYKPRPGLVPHKKFYISITSIFGHMHGVLNIDEKNQFLQIVNCETNLLTLISS